MALNLEETIPIINKIYLGKKHFPEVFLNRILRFTYHNLNQTSLSPW